jgi:hypothetical protein
VIKFVFLKRYLWSQMEDIGEEIGRETVKKEKKQSLIRR